ncbi:MAG TPA: hypothetical protein VKB62_11450 [Streptosporangiaceae bacterium]|nr:hypothetical protein [Streptosporangiaceae bacterium]
MARATGAGAPRLAIRCAVHGNDRHVPGVSRHTAAGRTGLGPPGPRGDG